MFQVSPIPSLRQMWTVMGPSILTHDRPLYKNERKVIELKTGRSQNLKVARPIRMIRV